MSSHHLLKETKEWAIRDNNKNHILKSEQLKQLRKMDGDVCDWSLYSKYLSEIWLEGLYKILKCLNTCLNIYASVSLAQILFS